MKRKDYLGQPIEDALVDQYKTYRLGLGGYVPTPIKGPNEFTEKLGGSIGKHETDFARSFCGLVKKQYHLVIIEGEAGSGKSTLCDLIAKKWASRSISLWKYVIRLDLREAVECGLDERAMMEAAVDEKVIAT